VTIAWAFADERVAHSKANLRQGGIVGTDKDWETWGRTDPYFGVISSDKYRRENMSEEVRAEFFRSGEVHVAEVLSRIRNHFESGFSPLSTLDFGCGVGRLVIALARHTKRVVGVDVSEAMIEEARRNCARAAVANADFVKSDDDLSEVSTTFDLVHTFIVLQHIPWSRGRRLMQRLSEQVNEGGYFCAQFLISCTASPLKRNLVRLRYALAPLNWLRNLMRHRPLFEPAMQLHVYDLRVIVSDLHRRGFDSMLLSVAEPTHDFEFESAFLIAQRSRKCSPLESRT
jgi:2-polyprenyl-3-methyl-5-hydroxy-6-metoxy-1,4-benzoquinol methylase